MKMSQLSGNGALKLLLLLTSLGHYYSGLVTGADPAKGICADLAANKSVDFFLVGANWYNRLLITAKPDYLVYELRDNTLHDDDTVNIYGVTPIPLKDYYPKLFENANLTSLLYSSSAVQVFTVGKVDNDNDNLNCTMYLKIIFPGLKLLFTYNMNSSSVDVVTNFDPPITATQQFVSPLTRKIFNKEDLYSFVNDQNGSRRMLYDSDVGANNSLFVRQDTTCNTTHKPETMVLRFGEVKCGDCNRYYNDWNWTVSPQGWADISDDLFSNVSFYLFDRPKQVAYIFYQNIEHIAEHDVFSVVHQKSYKDFFRCTPTPTTSTQPSTSAVATQVSSRSTAVPTTSSPTECSCPPVTITPSVITDDICRTSTEKPKIALWIIILIVVILVVILITVAFFVGYKLGSSNKSSDTKPDKVAFTNAASSVKQSQGNQLAVGSTGPTSSKLNAKSSAASKALTRSSMVAPSKGPASKVQGLKAK